MIGESVLLSRYEPADPILLIWADSARADNIRPYEAAYAL